MTAIRYGMARGIFSNEAGIGSASVTHASAKVNEPGEQAIWGPLEVFVDTCVVCLVTGLTIVLSGLWQGGDEGVGLTMAAFREMLPGNWGQYVVLCASILFGFSCLITYYNYLEKGWLLKLNDFFHQFCEKKGILHTPDDCFQYLTELPEPYEQLSLL